MKTYLNSLLIVLATASILLTGCIGGGEPTKIEEKEITEVPKELPDTFNIEGENTEITKEGLRVRLIVCDCEITVVGNNCEDHNYSVGDTITQPCYAETSCPCNGRRWLVFNDGCRIKARNIKDCYSRWFD
jgi:hypothetical protein